MPTPEAAAGYIHEVLRTLPDEQLGDLERVGGELRNKYDPSGGFVDDEDGEKPYDPWEDEACDPDIPVMQGLDIEALRAKAAKKAKRKPASS